MRIHAEYARAPERRIEHLIASGERTRMRGGGLRRRRGPTNFDDNDRFGQCHLASGGEKRARVSDALHVDDDAPRMRIIAEVVNEIAPVHIEHRADRDKSAEADVLSKAPIQDRCAQARRFG